MNAYSLDGLVVVALLIICSCAYLKRVPRINSWLLSEKKGFFGIFYKASVIGVRLHSFHKIKQKTTLPKGVKQKVKKAKQVGPKRGHNLYIAPKKQQLIQQDKIAAEVTKVINEKNEEMVKGRADTAVGRNKTD
ncbi:hypothetical protein Y032_0550g3304 [Ancylostoma ceylanicum]|uniref:Protein kish-B n=1 Tax=Ancylostoma ceylanicum TaxID=53326 RepID=A0A016WQQ2_9BILA|nr:hypothetical protein Y032_0550g3304 [Ancylostoma ceylanicum]